ncbi:MAG: hypothetical protein IJD14_00300 [Christensenellaceae bacterium]|nr:hypothetical protein [Christensenellaceae bacterium]
MKRLTAVVLALVCILCLVGCSKIEGHEGLIAKARKEINDLAEAETIEMAVAGRSTIGNNRHLYWIITGNEYQMHRYYPMEVTETESGEYEFVKLYNGGHERGQDIFFEYFGSGYSFIVNNPKCKSIVIDETTVPVTEIPFVYYHPIFPNKYYFLDEYGNELR